ncbi:ankyrin repeat [Anaeramoeba flamelloides]|uniref:Ankyrin repeat n=1 Tax=Anaeramoeba flamelloides TaxID=1746091 RepID=A0ABQ8Z8S4_9EUKA|nr:ankyrin repeat [Anaeramoeba flamelloides]
MSKPSLARIIRLIRTEDFYQLTQSLNEENINLVDPFGWIICHSIAHLHLPKKKFLEEIIGLGPDLHAVTPDLKESFFHFLCLKQDLGIGLVDLVLSKGFDPNQQNKKGLACFHNVCKYNTNPLPILKSFLSYGYGINLQDNNGFTGLIYLCLRKNIQGDCIKFLITKGADLHLKGNNGQNCIDLLLRNDEAQNNNVLYHVLKKTKHIFKPNYLHLLCQKLKPDLKTIKLICTQNVSIVNTRDENNFTAFQYLFLKESPPYLIIEYLLSIGSDVNDIYTNTKMENNILINYVSLNYSLDVKILELLIHKHNCDLNYENKQGETALFKIFQKNNLINYYECIKIFFAKRKGTNPIDISKYNEKMLSLAFKYPETNSTIIELLLKNGANAQMVDSVGNNLLHLALKDANVHIDLIKLLVEHKIDHNALNWYSCNALIVALQMPMVKDLKIIKLLIDIGSDIDISSHWGETPLMRLCANSERYDIPFFESLLKKIKNVNARNGSGESALLKVCERQATNYQQLIRLLIKYGAKTNIANNTGHVPLHLLCKSQSPDLELIKYFLERENTDPNIMTRKNNNLMHFACTPKIPNLDLINLLFKYKIDLNQKNSFGETPLSIRCRTQHFDIKKRYKMGKGMPMGIGKGIGKELQKGMENESEQEEMSKNKEIKVMFNEKGFIENLLQKGALVNFFDMKRNSPLNILFIYQNKINLEIVKLLLQKDSNLIFEKNYVGQTALIRACLRKNPKFKEVKLLVEWGSDINHKDNSSKNAFHAICNSKNAKLKIVKYFLDLKSNPNAKTTSGKTPFNYIIRTVKTYL